MVKFPLRKCYHAAKICLLLVLVVFVLALFEQWRGGKRAARAQFSLPIEEEYERQILEDEAKIIPGLGEGGVAAHLMGEDKRLGEESEKKLAVNVHLSERISYNRTLKDYRNPACKRVVYDAELPSASVIIIFHNEPYSVVVRTIWSVVNSARRDNPWFKHANFKERGTGKPMTLGSPGQDPSSPFVYLKEIILVDDNSTLPELKGKLSHYVRTRLPPDLIRILRLPDRVGLTRARLAGARYSAGDVLVFLDAHCEGQQDWLRPLLQRTKESPHAVVVPIIDVIDSSNFYYSVQDSTTFQVGGFSFMGHFTWIEVPEREKKRRGSDISPTWSPTMAGGLFAINRAYYWEIGAYDEQMAGWGGENLEMSFRIWQCGGTLETIPCSRVGHVFRSFHPYGLPAHTDTHGINTARMAEVWMDEYAELFYLHRPDLRQSPKIGDVTHRNVLREKLQCKSFQWYLDNVYKEKFVPVRDVYGYGRFRNPPSEMCLDTLQRENAASPLGVYPCHERLQATQYFSLSSKGELRDEENCAELQHKREDTDEGRRVLMTNCHGKGRGQKWRFLPSGQIQHSESGLCLDAGIEAGADAWARACSASAPSQRWDIDYNEDNDFRMANDVVPSQQEERLSKLRRQRRISRSLLSYKDPEDNSTVRRHSHKKRSKKHAKKRSHKKKTKNKFILKLVRSLGNHSEEHLEVDIHCSHRKLYPNNSFVRDLVTVLNDNDIKVINNGRVFERNKVTDLKYAPSGAERVLNKMNIARGGQGGEASAQTQKPRSKKRPRLQPLPLIPPMPSPEAPPPSRPAAPLTPPTVNKIIIEDFVEIATAPATRAVTERQKKHKRKHLRLTTTSTEPNLAERSVARASDDELIDHLNEVDVAHDHEDDRSVAHPAEPALGELSDGDSRDTLMKLLSSKKMKNIVDDERVQKLNSQEGSPKIEEQSMEDAPMVSSSEWRERDGATRSIGRERDGATRGRERDGATRSSGRERDGATHGRDRDGATGSERDGVMGARERDWAARAGGSERDGDRSDVWTLDSAFRSSPSDVRRTAHEFTSHQPHSDDEVVSSDERREQERREKHTQKRARIADQEKRVEKRRERLKSRDETRDHETYETEPVKVVMRSNLTFNLGDEFFAWRRQGDNNGELTDELTIPSNSSGPPPLPWAPPLNRLDSDEDDSNASDSSADK